MSTLGLLNITSRTIIYYVNSRVQILFLDTEADPRHHLLAEVAPLGGQRCSDNSPLLVSFFECGKKKFEREKSNIVANTV